MDCAREKIYANEGNAVVLQFLSEQDRRILDVGCGAGDLAALIRKRRPDSRIDGITRSAPEAEKASGSLDQCHCLDIEKDGLPAGCEGRFDALIFSHVLEHLADPVAALRRLVPLARPGGKIILAVPNVVYWKNRLRILAGGFEYEDYGMMDATHLRFFTHRTARKMLVDPVVELRWVETRVTASVPLGPLCRGLFPAVCAWIDRQAGRLLPNLFGYEILILAEHAV